MRFARQARIFRGTLDPGAVAGVLLLLLIFLLLSSLIYMPGVLIELPSDSKAAAMIVIKRSGEIVFDGKTYTADSMDQLRQDLKHSTETPTVQREPGAPEKAVDLVRSLFQIDPPIGVNIGGSDGPHVLLAVNFRGQCFFDDQLVSDLQLKTKLREAVADARRHSKELTLILYADKATENQVQTRLYQLASEAGVKKVSLVQQKSFWASPQKPGS
jgi:biopolymer transport protein ExbD